LKVSKRGKEIAQRKAVDCSMRVTLQNRRSFSTSHRRMSSEKAIQPLRAVPDAAAAPKETPTLPWDTASTSAEPAEQAGACEFCYGSGMEVVAGKGARRCRCRSQNHQTKLIEAARIPRRYDACTMQTYYPAKGNGAQLRAFNYAFAWSENFRQSSAACFYGHSRRRQTHLCRHPARIDRKGTPCLFYEFGALPRKYKTPTILFRKRPN
jgi:hypothetical protein